MANGSKNLKSPPSLIIDNHKNCPKKNHRAGALFNLLATLLTQLRYDSSVSVTSKNHKFEESAVKFVFYNFAPFIKMTSPDLIHQRLLSIFGQNCALEKKKQKHAGLVKLSLTTSIIQNYPGMSCNFWGKIWNTKKRQIWLGKKTNFNIYPKMKIFFPKKKLTAKNGSTLKPKKTGGGCCSKTILSRERFPRRKYIKLIFLT